MRVQVPFSILFLFYFLFWSFQTSPQSNIQIDHNANSINVIPFFENISIKDGLPENSITCILQDYLGYLWLGTQNGLVRYDGYTMKIFQPEENDSTGIVGRRITVIFEDRDKSLWIGTLNGLNKLVRENDSFESFQFSKTDTNSINSNEIYSIYEDDNNKFWIGTAEGLNLFDRNKRMFIRYYFRQGDSIAHKTSFSYYDNLCVNAIIQNPVSGNLFIGTAMDGLWEFNIKKETILPYQFSNDQSVQKQISWIQSFYKSRDDKIWIASFHTLCSIDLKYNKFYSYLNFPIRMDEQFSKRDFSMSSIMEDSNGLIWCGFYAGAQGLFCLNQESRFYKKYSIDPDTTKNSYGNHLHCVYIDRSNILWAGSWGLGLWKWDKTKNKFLSAYNNSIGLNNLNNTSATSLAYDPRGYVWLTSHRGLEKYDLNKERFYYYLQNQKCITEYNSYTTFIDKSGNVWIGTGSCGLIKFNPSNDSYQSYFNDPNERVNLANQIILTMNQDSQGRIWIGTEGFGYYKYEVAQNKLTQFKHNPDDTTSITNDNARSFYEDRSGILWFGTNFGGLNKFDQNSETFQYCGFNCVLSIYEDKLGNFWVADYYTGLNLFDRKTNKIIKSFGRNEGLLSYSIWGILEDSHNNLWIKTDNGLFKFNTITKTIKRFTTEDGLIDNFFLPYPTSHCYGPDSTMLFLCSKVNVGKGVVIFHPDSIREDNIKAEVLITNIASFNHPDEKLDYNGFISEIKEIILPYYENDLRIDYVGLQYSEPSKNQYKYVLENFDKDWIDARISRQATYTNLEPGEYVFKVIAANRDGIWNEQGASLKIIILHPWWATSWAYFIYAIIILSSLYFLWKLQLRRIRIKHELEMGRFEKDKLQEVDKLKTRFFTNISHEFRTPLTLIQAPAKVIVDRSEDQDIKDSAKLIYRNAIKLNGLVNQLLDLAKLEAGEMILKVSESDLIGLLDDIIISFTPFAERKKIKFKFNSNVDKLRAYLDKDKIQIIINNILSNAFKFTAEGGEINVNVLTVNSNVKIVISDTGIGVPSNRLEKIFDRFYQVDDTHTREHEGTGIGLALTKELVDLHKGKIEVESKEGAGSTFTITFLLGKENYSSDQIISEKDMGNISKSEKVSLLEPQTTTNQIDIDILSEENKPLLLVADDNNDVRNFIKGILENDYKILEARNGLEGLEISFIEIPDLIICDLMMPKLDGFEMSAKLKNDERTSHIPIIMLTAKATSKDKLEGYETGADDYIIKPFDAQILKSRVKNLIEQRRKLKEYFTSNGLFYLDKSKVSNIDKIFLQKVIDVINKHLSDPLFGVELLAEEIAISRTTLNKKLVGLIGEPPGEFIKRIKLTKASRLLRNNHENISQIALEVGFSNPAYFSECFRKQFGVSPTQYLQKFNNH